MAKIDIKLIQELRNKTGLGLMDCKKALIEADGNIEKAIEILRKKGAAVAAKRASKETAQGLVHSYIHPGSRLGTLVEINCETDFVARTEDMKKFAHFVSIQVAAMKPKYVSAEDIDPAELEKEKTILKEQMAESGKPEQVIEKIVEGRMKKWFAEVCLLDQPSVKDEKQTIRDVMQELIGRLGENIKIKRFCRFEIGQE